MHVKEFPSTTLRFCYSVSTKGPWFFFVLVLACSLIFSHRAMHLLAFFLSSVANVRQRSNGCLRLPALHCCCFLFFAILPFCRFSLRSRSRVKFLVLVFSSAFYLLFIHFISSLHFKSFFTFNALRFHKPPVNLAVQGFRVFFSSHEGGGGIRQPCS